MRTGAGPGEESEEPRARRLWSRMGGPALCGLAALAATAILLLTVVHSRGGSVEWEARPAAPLFRGASRVVDLPLGQLDWAERLRGEAEVCVLVLYAPWCARCVRAVPHVEHVARALAGQVLFIAVNCWWPKGRCRRELSFSFFPAIHVYHTGLGPIPYDGPLVASYLQSFVERVMVPVTHVATPHHLLDFLATSEPGILGFFEFSASPQPPGYLEFYQAALLSLQRDGTAPLRFGVLTSSCIAQLSGLLRSGSVCMHRLFNSTVVFPETGMGATAEALYLWAAGVRQPPLLQWLWPTGRKSLLLNRELRKGPALIFFLPSQPSLSDGHELLHMAEELALEYHNCDCSEAVSLFTRHLRGKQCDEPAPAEMEPGTTTSLVPCCSCLLLRLTGLSRWPCACELCTLLPAHACTVGLPALPVAPFPPPAVGGCMTCSSMRGVDSYGSHRLSLCCRPLGRSAPESQPAPRHSASSHLPPVDHTASLNFPSEPCGVSSYLVAGGLGGGSCDGGGGGGSTGAVAALRGLRCRTNRTLRFYAMDAELHWEFAKRLGAAPRPPTSLTFVTIVSVEHEQHHVLQHNHTINRTQLVDFIEKFSHHHSSLQRHLSSGSSTERPPSPSAQPPFITEVTTSTFHELVLDPGKDVLLLYYATWCGLCSTLSHRYWQLASLLQHNPHLRFARINGDTNDLPWEFMVEKYPALLLFPAHRKAMSVRYPDEASFSLPELGQFLVRHVSGAAREHLAPRRLADVSTPSGGGGGGSDEEQQAELHRQQREAGHLRESAQALAAAESRLRGRVSALWRERGHLQRDVRRLGHAANQLRRRWGQLWGPGDRSDLPDDRGDSPRGDAAVALAFQRAVRALSAENALLKLYIVTLERKVNALAQQQREGQQHQNKRKKEKPQFHEHYQQHQWIQQQLQQQRTQPSQQLVELQNDEEEKHYNHYEQYQQKWHQQQKRQQENEQDLRHSGNQQQDTRESRDDRAIEQRCPRESPFDSMVTRDVGNGAATEPGLSGKVESTQRSPEPVNGA